MIKPFFLLLVSNAYIYKPEIENLPSTEAILFGNDAGNVSDVILFK